MRNPTQSEQSEGIAGVYSSVAPCLWCLRDTNFCFNVRQTGCKARVCSQKCADSIPVMAIPHPLAMRASSPAPSKAGSAADTWRQFGGKS